MKTLQQIVDKAKRLVFFGGAGVSTASGIPDFRGGDRELVIRGDIETVMDGIQL